MLKWQFIQGLRAMADYTSLISLVVQMPRKPVDWRPVLRRLKQLWLDDYGGYPGQVTAVDLEGFGYLFDTRADRLVAAWGISGPKPVAPRDKSRMASHPLSVGPLYHRGHAIAHSLGGGTDINLVPQLGRLNVGSFRSLEKLARDNPGSLYFTYWLYEGARAAGQTPSAVEQGLLAPGCRPDVRRHLN